MGKKVGQRNSRSDRQRIRQIRQQANSIVATTLELEPSASDEMTTDAETKATQIDPAAHPGAMVALMLTPEQQMMLAPYRVGDMVDSEADHITLLYLGDDAELLTGYKNKIIECLACIATECPPLAGRLNGYGRFSGNSEVYPVYANYDSAGLFKLRSKIAWKLSEMGAELPSEHGFTPHLTLGYLPQTDPLPVMDMPSLTVNFAAFSLIWAGERIDYMLLGTGEEYEEEEHRSAVAVEIEVSGAAKGVEFNTDKASIADRVVTIVFKHVSTRND